MPLTCPPTGEITADHIAPGKAGDKHVRWVSRRKCRTCKRKLGAGSYVLTWDAHYGECVQEYELPRYTAHFYHAACHAQTSR